MFMLLLFAFRVAERPPVWEKKLFIRFTVRVFRERFLKFCVCHSFCFGIEGGMLYVVVLIPDHCFSFYFTY